MSFRARLALVAAAAVALAIVAASFVVYFVVRDQLRATVDASLETTAAQLAETPVHDFNHFAAPPSQLGGAPGYPQIVSAAGDVFPRGARVALPVTDRVEGVARNGTGTFLMDSNVNDTHIRVITFPYAPGFAVEVARPLTEVDHSLGRIENYLILIAGGGIAIAAALGLAVSRAALAPVRARGIDACAAAAGRRRVARAEDAADEPADEHRGAGERPHAAARRTRAAAQGRGRAAR